MKRATQAWSPFDESTNDFSAVLINLHEKFQVFRANFVRTRSARQYHVIPG